MKIIEIDDELYQYIASQTQHIGESASSILRRLLIIKDNQGNTLTELNQSTNFASLTSLVNRDDFLAEKKSINRFLLILSELYNVNKSLFSVAATSLHGSKRRYLAKDEETLLRFGNNTKPKQIPDTPYMVVTNTNTARKVYIIKSLMNNMEISNKITELVLSKFVS